MTRGGDGTPAPWPRWAAELTGAVGVCFRQGEPWSPAGGALQRGGCCFGVLGSVGLLSPIQPQSCTAAGPGDAVPKHSQYGRLYTPNVSSLTVLCRKSSLFLFKYWGNRACYLVKDLCKWLFVSHDWALQSVSYIDNVIIALLPFQSSTLWRSLQFL